ncbi:MAG: PIN domain-containing protein, partial [Nitrososphaerales archaeon]
LPALRDFFANSDLALTTIPEVVKELEGLALNRKPLTSRKASNALRLVGTSIQLMQSSEGPNVEADIALYEQAKSLDDGSFVATLDGKLLSRFEKSKLPYLTLRHDRPFVRTFSRATYLSTKKP